jgi:hypothetical protein
MEKDASWNSLHDAVLVSVRFEWAEALVAILLRTSHGGIEISVHGVVMLECPRRLPWGRSSSVLSASLADNDSNGDPQQTLELEMQSGDLIKVVGKNAVMEQKSLVEPDTAAPRGQR